MLLNASIAFLAIPGVATGEYNSVGVAQVVIQGSMVLSLGSILSGLALLKKAGPGLWENSVCTLHLFIICPRLITPFIIEGFPQPQQDVHIPD